MSGAAETRDSLGPPGLLHNVLNVALVIAGLTATYGFVAVPLEPAKQFFLAGATIIIALLASRSRSRAVSLFLVFLSVLVSLRYLFWRILDTLKFDNFFESFLGFGLMLAEVYAFLVLALGYLQTAWPLERRPAVLPGDPETWPTVDVYIPTYNESLDVVRPTVLAALSMDWPPGKFRVYILDDGRRPEFRAFALACGAGYITRPDNKYAKAGNLNHALARTSGEFIAVFDCDHVPTRAFLQMTMGWLIADPKIAFVQTPHHFFTPEPVHRNLVGGEQVPAEGNMFYGLVQPGNDMWNAAFFCGSCAVLRRKALLEIGGFAADTVTEDAHTALRLHRRGWQSAYLRLPLAAGLGTDNLRAYIGQRMRWSRGMLQIFRIDNPMLGSGLRITQRLCYFNAMLHFLYALPRVVLLTAPLSYLLLGQSIVAASPVAMIGYALPHIFLSTLTNSRIHGRWRYSFWSELYETTLAFFLVPVTLQTLFSSRSSTFNVTEKNVQFERGFFDLRAVYPILVVVVLLTLGVLRGIWLGFFGFATADAADFAFATPLDDERASLALNMAWATFSLLIALGSLAVGRETRQTGNRAPIPAELPIVAFLPDGRAFPGMGHYLSIDGVIVTLDLPEQPQLGAEIDIEFDTDRSRTIIPARLAGTRGRFLQLNWNTSDIVNELHVTQVLFGRADAWLTWDKYPTDRPLRSFAKLLTSIGGLLRIRSDASRRPERTDIASALARLPGEPSLAALQPDAAGYPARDEVLTIGQRFARAAQVAGVTLLCLLLPFAALGQPRGAALDQALPTVITPLPSGPMRPAEPFSGPGATTLAPIAAPPATPLTTPAAAPAPLPPAALPSAVAAAGETREVVWKMTDIGAAGPIWMRGDPSFRSLDFGVADDEVVVNAKLTLSGAISPQLVPEFTSIAIALNNDYVGSVLANRDGANFGPLEIPANPVLFVGRNVLTFRFTGRYARECVDPLSPLIWANISDQSTLTMTLARVPVRREMARLPLPFFDPNIRRRLVLPFILSPNTSPETLRSAAIVASWFGALSGYRGVDFPVGDQPPRRGNAVLLVTGAEAPAGVNLPPINGPTVAEIPNPQDRYGTILVVAGRTADETAAAARMLALGTAGLRGESMLVEAPKLSPRRPYDAPGWVSTERPVKFGELVETEALQGIGYFPGTMRVPFRTSPDLFTWRLYPFLSRLKFRGPDDPILDTSYPGGRFNPGDLRVTRLDVGMNSQFLNSYPLSPARGSFAWVGDLVGWERPVRETRTELPTYAVAGENELQMTFDMHPLARGDCVAVPDNIHTGIDPDSTIDLTRAYHFTKMPNLAFFASVGFPFTRMADLSDTAAVLADRPGTVEMQAFLNLMGRIASKTLYPVAGLTVLRARDAEGRRGKHLLVFGTLGQMEEAADALRETPYRINGNRLDVLLPSPLADIWHIFGDTRSDERQRATAGLAVPLGDNAALLSGRSPVGSGHSVVALLAGTPRGLLAMVRALDNEQQLQNISGDLTLLKEGQATSYRAGSIYTMGSLPLWLWPIEWAGDRPELVLIFSLLGAALLGWLVTRIVPRRSRRRLQVPNSDPTIAAPGGRNLPPPP